MEPKNIHKVFKSKSKSWSLENSREHVKYIVIYKTVQEDLSQFYQEQWPKYCYGYD